LVTEVRDIDNKTDDLLANTKQAINEVKKSIIAAVKNGDFESIKEIDQGILKKLKSIIDGSEEKAKIKDNLVNPEKQKQLNQKHAELVARKKLAKHKAAIVNHIDRINEADILTKIINSLNSRTVSTKASQLSQIE